MSAGLSAALVCLLFVAGDRGTDGALRFPLQRVSATKCSIMQDGFLLQKQLPQWISYTFVRSISTDKCYCIMFYA